MSQTLIDSWALMFGENFPVNSDHEFWSWGTWKHGPPCINNYRSLQYLGNNEGCFLIYTMTSINIYLVSGRWIQTLFKKYSVFMLCTWPHELPAGAFISKKFPVTISCENTNEKFRVIISCEIKIFARNNDPKTAYKDHSIGALSFVEWLGIALAINFVESSSPIMPRTQQAHMCWMLM